MNSASEREPKLTWKPRILLIPNVMDWILADMCRHIQRAFADRFEFLIIPETLFEARPNLWDAILPAVDLVHCMNESSGAILAARGGAVCPVVVWIHHVTQWSPEHEAACQVSHAVVACTEGWKQTLARFTTKPVTVVRHGVDLDRFRFIPDAARMLSIPEKDFVVGFFASKGSDQDGSRKGIDTLIEVMTRCARQIPNLRILLLGPGWNAQLFESAGLQVSYPGHIGSETMAAAYSALDLYLMTARIEGGPCTVLESMACGTPVVATRVGLVPDVIVDGENGISAEVGDAEGLSQAVLRMAADPALRTRLGASARLTATQRGWDVMLAPLAAVYDTSLASASVRAQALPMQSAEIETTVMAADAILKFRYALHADLKQRRLSRSLSALKAVVRRARSWSTLKRGYRLAARGEL